jgi:hypothetical protein
MLRDEGGECGAPSLGGLVEGGRRPAMSLQLEDDPLPGQTEPAVAGAKVPLVVPGIG